MYFQLTHVSIDILLFRILNYLYVLFEGFLSHLLNAYLSWRNPILHADGKTSIPSLAYVWPNGQGDAAKFLDGSHSSKKWGENMGSIYRIWSGMTPEIVLTKPEEIKDVFKDSNRHSKAIANDSGYLMHQLLGDCLGLISGNSWEAVRDAVQGPFLRSKATGFVQPIRNGVASYFDSIDGTGNLAKRVIDPAKDLSMLPFLMIARIIYGELKQLASIREELFRYAMSGGLARFSWSKYLPLRANSLLAEFKARWKHFNNRIIAFSSSKEFPTPLSQMSRSVSTGMVTEEQFYQTLDEILFANLDVTTGGISWALTFLAAYPDYQSQIRAEIHQAKASHQLDVYLLQSSTLLNACILESSRLKPVAAFSVPQSAPTMRVVQDFVIPPKTNFIVDTHAINIRNGFWGDDALRYRPERFLKRAPSELRYNFWRFGFGPRQCLGKYVADLIIRATIVHMLMNCNLECTEGGGAPARNPELWIDCPVTLLRCVKRGEAKRSSQSAK